MNQKGKQLLGDVSVLALSNFSTKILSFLLVPLYTSCLSTDEYGMFDLVLVTVELFLPILTLNIFDALMRFLLDSKKSNDEVISIAIKYLCIGVLSATVLVIIVSHISIFAIYKDFCGLIWLYFVFSVIYKFATQTARGLDYIKNVAVASVISTVVNLSMNIFCLLVLDMRLKGFLLANVVALISATVYLLLSIRIWTFFSKIKENKNLEKEMLVYCTPLILTMIAWWANNSVDKYVVTWMYGVAANGLISVAYKIPSIVNVIQSVFIQAWQISAIKEYESEDGMKFYESVYEIFNLIFCLLGFFLILFTKIIARILFSNDFYSAWKYVPFLVIAVIINSAAGFLGAILSAQHKSKSLAISAVVGLISNTVLNVILIYSIGIQGATIATAASSFMIYMVRKHYVMKFISKSKHFKLMVQWGLLGLHAIVKIYELPIIYEGIIGGIILIMNISVIISNLKK